MIYYHLLLTVVVVALIWMFNKTKQIYNRLNKKNSKIPDVNIIKKIIPISKVAGWKVATVYNGMPLWKYCTSFTFSPSNLYATRTLISTRSSKVLEELVDIKTFSSLFPGLPQLKVHHKDAQVSNKDVLSLSNIFSHLSLTSILRNKDSAFTLERFWFCEPTSSWLYMCPTTSIFTYEFGYWICFYLQDLEDGNSSLLHILASFPKATSTSQIKSLLSSCSILVKDHMEHIVSTNLFDKSSEDRTIKSASVESNIIYPIPDKFKPITRAESPSSMKKTSVASKTTRKPIVREAFGYFEEPAVINRIPSPVENTKDLVPEDEMKFKKDKTKVRAEQPKEKEIIQTKSQSIEKEPIQEKHESICDEESVHAESSEYEIEEEEEEDLFKDYVVDPKLLPLVDQLKAAFDTVMEAYEADESTPGWEIMGNKDNVIVYRKNDDISAYSSLMKGVTTIKDVPFPYLLHYAVTLDYKKEYDSMFEAGSDIEHFNDGVSKIANLIFQNMWPTTGRDFVSLTGLRHLKDNMYGIAVKAVEHADCPPRKNKVRGEIVTGGFVFKLISENPHEIEVTYIARAELKGSIPQYIIDKVAAQQPYSVGVLRKHVERRYKKNDPPRDIGQELINKIKAVPSVYPPPKKKIKKKKLKKTKVMKIENIPNVVNNEESVHNEVVNTANNTSAENLINVDSEILVNGNSENVVNVDSENLVNSELQQQVSVQSDVNASQTNQQSSGTSVIVRNQENKLENNIANTSQDQNEIIDTNTKHDQVDNNESQVTSLYNPSIVDGTATSTPLNDNHKKSNDSLLDSGLDLHEDFFSSNNLGKFKKSDSYQSDLSISDMSQMTDDFGSQLSVSEQKLDLPRDSSGHIDFITLGNQTAASLEEEFFIAQKKIEEVKLNPTIGGDEGEWVYQGTNKDVVIMRKIQSAQKFHSFLGRGVINVLPITLWEAIKNPTTRFVYDNMLKNTKVIKEISNRHKIVHMRHETHACFIKQARDFCVLTVERVEQQRYVIAATSVDIAECPPVQDCVRGRVLSSGWIIEPTVRNGRSCSLVTYISQINFGGKIPTRLINLISKKQPLALAYLRDYLEASEM